MASLPIIDICAGVNRPARLLSDGQTVKEFDTWAEARAARQAACSASLELGLIFDSANRNRERA